jgi:hypothetical protein
MTDSILIQIYRHFWDRCLRKRPDVKLNVIGLNYSLSYESEWEGLFV